MGYEQLNLLLEFAKITQVSTETIDGRGESLRVFRKLTLDIRRSRRNRVGERLTLARKYSQQPDRDANRVVFVGMLWFKLFAYRFFVRAEPSSDRPLVSLRIFKVPRILAEVLKTGQSADDSDSLLSSRKGDAVGCRRRAGS